MRNVAISLSHMPRHVRLETRCSGYQHSHLLVRACILTPDRLRRSSRRSQCVPFVSALSYLAISIVWNYGHRLCTI
jgi:hypothetical protein